MKEEDELALSAMETGFSGIHTCERSGEEDELALSAMETPNMRASHCEKAEGGRRTRAERDGNFNHAAHSGVADERRKTNSR